MNLIKLAAATALLSFSVGSLAAKPTSIVFKSNSETTDGTPYSQYEVKCSNGKKVPLTAWDKRRKWCVGEASAADCEKKQIKAAKAACDAV
ncbi:hypothetical protein H2508_09010 [Parahaliea sp. F7430]|uniref:Uncharacterized protein n=1 Tax=Sediminihaliea albiluteola TaxID=2758564 RepID=A0A7W2TWK6_9GAMM|nr:hypothetical protein [Sediminihaliea albiluteola]MBA6413246.1 hypothetical protein [Sediminihaliea albiluteola]